MSSLQSAFIIDGVRTPIGNFAGTLSTIRPDDMAALVIRELMKKFPGVDPAQIGDVLLGCANQAGEDNRNVARMSLLLAGLPVTVPGETVNRLCASGLSASISGARAIMCGDADLIIAGGVENMTRGPWVMSKTSTPFGRDAQLFDSSFGWRFINPKMKEQYGVDAMGETAENLADRDKVSREDQDKFSLWSQQKAAKAQERGRFKKEIVPVPIPQKKGDPILFEKDEFMKPSTTLEGLMKLRASFRKDGTVTAGNASGLNDGAAVLLLASENGVKQNNLRPLARIVSMGVAGVEPRIMGIGPVQAANTALKKAGLTMNDIDLIELNEAFASQSIAVARELGINPDVLNVNGGAISMGHPLGCSGAKLTVQIFDELRERKKKFGMVTMCVGTGQGAAGIFEML